MFCVTNLCLVCDRLWSPRAGHSRLLVVRPRPGVGSAAQRAQKRQGRMIHGCSLPACWHRGTALCTLSTHPSSLARALDVPTGALTCGYPFSVPTCHKSICRGTVLSAHAAIRRHRPMWWRHLLLTFLLNSKATHYSTVCIMSRDE